MKVVKTIRSTIKIQRETDEVLKVLSTSFQEEKIRRDLGREGGKILQRKLDTFKDDWKR